MALVFVASWSLKVAHTLCIHHAHRGVPVCEAAHQGNTKHFHDERYNPDDCSVCAFLFAIPELVSAPVLPEQPAAILEGSLPVAGVSFHCADPESVQLRGPPVF